MEIPDSYKNLVIDEINKTREYLDYLENHYNNIQKAWKEFQEKCLSLECLNFLHEKTIFGESTKLQALNRGIMIHDYSKLSKFEFLSYRRKFFPTNYENIYHNKEIEDDFQTAWKIHISKNDHHWQWWERLRMSSRYGLNLPDDWRVSCVHAMIDWIAVSYFEGKSTALDYYNNNLYNEKVIPDYCHMIIREVLKKFYRG